MALPFTPEQFLDGFARFNSAAWPLHLVAGAVAVGTLVAALRGGRAASRAAAFGLAALWLASAAHHAIALAGVSSSAVPFAALFTAQAMLLAHAGETGRLAFGRHAPLGLALVAYAAIGYPAIGLLAGHAWPEVPAFGVAPCPNVIFTFGVLLLAADLPRRLLAIPVLWSIVGISAAASLGMTEDWGLPVAAVTAVGALARRRYGAGAAGSACGIAFR
jgi:hypothetical protein